MINLSQDIASPSFTIIITKFVWCCFNTILFYNFLSLQVDHYCNVIVTTDKVTVEVYMKYYAERF